MSANAQANLVHDFESPLQCKAEHAAVSKIHAKLSGDLNVQIKGPGKLRLYFLPNLYCLLEKEFAETTNSIQFFWCTTLTARF